MRRSPVDAGSTLRLLAGESCRMGAASPGGGRSLLPNILEPHYCYIDNNSIKLMMVSEKLTFLMPRVF